MLSYLGAAAALVDRDAKLTVQLTGDDDCRYQGLVCSAMVEKELEFVMLVAIVNNNLIAYDQSRDLAFAIDSAIKQGTREEGEERRSDGSTESLSMNLTETEVHAEMEDTCRCVPCAHVLLDGKIWGLVSTMHALACEATQFCAGFNTISSACDYQSR
jgi:hypothetical protein